MYENPDALGNVWSVDSLDRKGIDKGQRHAVDGVLLVERVHDPGGRLFRKTVVAVDVHGVQGRNRQGKSVQRKEPVARPRLFEDLEHRKEERDDEPNAGNPGLEGDEGHFGRQNGHAHPAQL